MLHLCVLVAYAKNSTRHELLGGSFAPAALLTLAFGMHAMWFVQCVKGNIRRWRKRSAARITVNSGTEVSATLEEVKVQARNEGDDNRTMVHVLDPSNLEVIIEPTRVTVDSEQEHSPVGALSTSLPELYHPQTDEESNSSSEEDEIRMSRSEFALRTPPIPVSYPTSKGVSLDSELKYRGSFSGAGTTLTSSSSSMLWGLLRGLQASRTQRLLRGSKSGLSHLLFVICSFRSASPNTSRNAQWSSLVLTQM